jgi:ribonucleoside-diphosphate reductase alpha chain
MNWQHEDSSNLLEAKNWHNMKAGDTTLSALKQADFNFPAPLDMMNVSLNYDDAWLNTPARGSDPIFVKNVRQAMMTGEPGFSFNFGEKENETLRNACTEITSEDDSDVCNLGSVNLANINSIEEFGEVVGLASKFLVCGLIRAQLPYEKVEEVRQKNSRIGLGLMGMHEWLLKRGYKYEMVDELKQWMKTYERESKRSADAHCDRLFLNRPKGYRAIAPTGTISILAGTTSGVEPIYAVAYRRRYLADGTRWKHQFVVDGTAQELIDSGIKPDKIESAVDLAFDPERRVKFQYELQKNVDHAISSTLNLPAWGTESNNEDTVVDFQKIIANYAPGLRGLTVYPDGARGGQPITSVPYEEAHSKRGVVYEDNSEEQCLSGVCGI